MAIKFNTSKISQVEYATSTIEKFNGVDKTTTPTEIDNSRAVEMSNYLPDGNSLVKRYGTKKINNDIFTYLYNQSATNLKLLDFWSYDGGTLYYFKLNKSITSNSVTTTYNHCLIYKKNTNYTVKWLTTSKDDYSSAIQYENKLFILCNSGFFVFDGLTFSNLVDNAYIPYAYTINVSTSVENVDEEYKVLESFNLLTNRVRLKVKGDYKLEVSRDDDNIYLEANIIYKWTGYNNLENVYIDSGIDFSEFVYDGVMIYNGNSDYEEPYLTKISLQSETISGNDDYVEVKNVAYTNYLKLDNSLTSTEKNELFEKIKNYINNYELEAYGELVRENTINIADFKYMKSYGTNGYTDRLFLFGNPNYPNLDIHSGYASQTINRWKDYTYFPDDAYQVLGSSDKAITGYGILSNGVMAIFKQSKDNEPNLYFRTAVNTTTLSSDNTVASTMYGYDEYYPITRSGVNIGSDYFDQVIQFGNDLLINTPSGLFRIDVGTSTATQTYLAKEVSYFLRNEWSSDMTGSIHCVFGNKLFIKRKNKDGIYRIYVADMNRYSFNDSIQQYEWWILDDIDVDKFKVVDNELYMINENGVYKFNEGSFVDEDYVELNSVQVSDTTISTELFFDGDYDKFILSSDSHFMSEVLDSSNKYAKYQELINDMTINIDDNKYMLEVDLDYEISEQINTYTEGVSEFPVHRLTIKDVDEDFDLFDRIKDIMDEDDSLMYFEYYNPSKSHVQENYAELYIHNVSYEYDDNNKKNVLIDVLVVRIPYTYNPLTDEDSKLYLSDFMCQRIISNNASKYNAGLYVKDLYFTTTINSQSVSIPFSQVTYDGNKFIWINNGTYEELTSAVFNEIEYGLKLFGKKYTNNFKIFFTDNDNLISKVTLYKITPVKSYWYSKFNSCGHIEYLKTANYLYFVPETKRGGKTHIGYRTNKKEVGYDTRYFTRQLDFNDIDFDEFSFGELEFGHSISSKKKIKNFSFIQLIAYSNESLDSTLAQLTFRYRYTKNNKGVK